ncbi:MAG: hypothetical protein IJ560_02830 [Alphaproteobacteria bacterium]|nr:hypothetical protein [Alphaproteobacteria bacterium]
MQLNKNAAERLIADLGMDDMPIMAVRAVRVPVAGDWFARYKNTVRQFLGTLTECVQELAFMNLTQDEFMELMMGRAVPPNLSVRFRIPLVWGGDLSVANMFMCYTFPHSHNMDRFIIAQTGNDIVWVPNPAKKIYLPTHTAGGGDGGNATEDRLAQMAAQIAQNRGME